MSDILNQQQDHLFGAVYTFNVTERELTESTGLMTAGKIKRSMKGFNQIFADVTGCSGNVNLLAVVILGR